MSNPLYPDLNTPCLEACIDYRECESDQEGAIQELSDLKESIKAFKEDRERANRGMADLTEKLTKRVDELCEIRDALKAVMQDKSSSAKDRRDETMRQILKKHFGVDIQ